VFLFLVFSGLGVVYAATKVPLPSQVQTSQTSVIYYSDGKTVMARLGAENRTDVPLAQVPVPVRRAVLAAENRSYYTDPGVSVTGIVRALWADIRGQPLQGGSTITQQYAKKAYLTDQRTLTRKLKEVVLAVKLDRSYSKDQILEWYLNTIYFGRGAYGIQAAAETYFGVPASKLTVEQGAVLAASINSPSALDPKTNPTGAKARWNYVLDGMVQQGWLTRQQRAAAKYPAVSPPGATSFNNLSGPNGYIVAQAQRELAGKGISEDLLRRGGLRVVTTVDKKAQDAAVYAVNTAFKGQPKDIRQALVAVQPGTGRVVAYYGGTQGYGYFDYATSSHPPGSSIKAYVLATALEQGISVKSFWNGSSPQTFPDRPTKPVYNSGEGRGEQCPFCRLDQATADSLNTVYYALTAKVGAVNAAKMAEASGISYLRGKPIAQVIAAGVRNNFGIGEYEITTLDQADGFATFAAGGMHFPPYFVEKVTRGDTGQVVYQHRKPAGNRAFSASTAADADWALQKVITSVPQGSPLDRRLDGGTRPAAAKTGTVQLGNQISADNADAWIAGYTPQLAAAVWAGHDKSAPLKTADGLPVYGIGLPGKAWQLFMERALAGQPVLQFPSPVFKGNVNAGNATQQIASPPPVLPAPTRAPPPSPTPAPSRPAPTPTPTKPNPICPSPPACGPSP